LIVQNETYLFFVLGGLLSDFREFVGWVAASSDVVVLSGPWLLLLFSIDTSRSVVESLDVGDWLLEVSALLWDVLFHDGSKSNRVSSTENACKNKNQKDEKVIRGP